LTLFLFLCLSGGEGLSLLPASIIAQDSIYVKATYDKSATFKELTVEIVNKANKIIGIPNSREARPGSHFEIIWYDKNGEQIEAKYPPATFGVFFINEKDGYKLFFSIEPKSSITFTNSKESLLRNFCKEPERVKKMKLKFHLILLGSGGPQTYEQYSKMFTL